MQPVQEGGDSDPKTEENPELVGDEESVSSVPEHSIEHRNEEDEKEVEIPTSVKKSKIRIDIMIPMVLKEGSEGSEEDGGEEIREDYDDIEKSEDSTDYEEEGEEKYGNNDVITFVEGRARRKRKNKVDRKTMLMNDGRFTKTLEKKNEERTKKLLNDEERRRRKEERRWKSRMRKYSNQLRKSQKQDLQSLKTKKTLQKE